ncbi:acyltransferase [Acidisoma cellulosilytica]|uniref:Acyltransferase n=1 Tax=Acidisoma cellulosilyticum TaxID=2802395 RepID=A0A963Z6N1_9PROT|nr:acyltransferase [Acidisoma cellulosilyticum]MCB8883481.1 acyltransferase [Acidisoma cellulosilyticum]
MTTETGAPLRHQNRALTSIRGIMALWVVGHHLQFGLSVGGYDYAAWLFGPGYVGVDVFFVLSGFVITAVHRDMTSSSTGDFFIRRIFRIYPLHWFVLAIILAIWVRQQWIEGLPLVTDHLASLPIVALLLQPYLLHEPNWNVASWSIGVEMLCYLLFPLAILVLRRMTLVVSLAALVIAVLYERHTHSEMVWGWPAIARGLSGFALGMMVQQMTLLFPRPRTRLATSLELAAVGLMAVTVLLRHLALFPIPAALLIYALAAERGVLSRALSGPVWYWLGQISFSVYLLHPTVIALFSGLMPPKRLLAALGLTLGQGLTALVWTVLVIGTLLTLASLTWRLIEDPARRCGIRLARRLG